MRALWIALRALRTALTTLRTLRIARRVFFRALVILLLLLLLIETAIRLSHPGLREMSVIRVDLGTMIGWWLGWMVGERRPDIFKLGGVFAPPIINRFLIRREAVADVIELDSTFNSNPVVFADVGKTTIHPFS